MVVSSPFSTSVSKKKKLAPLMAPDGTIRIDGASLKGAHLKAACRLPWM
jgi:hypothetical protein